MIDFRPARASDLDDLYAISLATGDKGKDATSLHTDPKLIGHIYSAPYLIFQPDMCFVAEDEEGVVGFIVGTGDTAAFENMLEEKWWPDLRLICEDPPRNTRNTWNADQQRCAAIHHPELTFQGLSDAYPAHIHMNLLPRGQGQRAGTTLLNLWLDRAHTQGITHVHLGANPENTAGMAFWRKSGFKDLEGTAKLPSGSDGWLAREV